MIISTNFDQALLNMKVELIPNVVSVLGTLVKKREKNLEEVEISGRIETFKTTALMRSARILRRVLETRGDSLSLRLQRKTTSVNC